MRFQGCHRFTTLPRANPALHWEPASEVASHMRSIAGYVSPVDFKHPVGIARQRQFGRTSLIPVPALWAPGKELDC